MKGVGRAFVTIGFYIVYGFVYLISLLPLRVLYVLCRVLIVWPMRLFGYRRSVVLTNLARSFPEKQYGWIRHTAHLFYNHLGDLFAEVIWLFSATPAQRLAHLPFPDFEFMKEWEASGRTTLVVMGHFGNWEFTQNEACSPRGTMGSYPLPHVGITFLRQTDGVFDRVMYALRTRCRSGFHVIDSREFVKFMFAHRKEAFMYCLIADQCPPTEDSRYSLSFLGQPTLMIEGPEVLARRFNCCVAYASLQQIKRGVYQVQLTPITDNPKAMEDGAITRRFAELLEADVRCHPESWLWSHKRWKRRPNI